MARRPRLLPIANANSEPRLSVTENWGRIKKAYGRSLKAQWKMMTLETYAAPLRGKPVDTITTDDVLAVLKPIWITKAETASRVRGRIEKVLDAAKAKGFRDGENPARWRGHLDHLLPKPSKLARGHHAAMPYENVAAFIAKLRAREATSALALELC